MRIACCLFLLVFANLHADLQVDEVVLKVDFLESMDRATDPQQSRHSLEDNATGRRYLSLYERNMPSCLKRNPGNGIPKIIHQIWLGSPLPEKFKHLQASWKQHHPTWTYILWTDADIKKMNMRNRAQYEQAQNYAEKSDILRYELLQEWGGVYVDIDFECFRPLDILVENFEFFSGVPAWVTVSLNNGLIGTIPNHPIINACVEDLAGNYAAQTEVTDGNFGIFDRSGPYYFTRCFMKASSDESDGVIIFPATFLYPFPPVLNRSQRTHDFAVKWLTPESFAIHYWMASWLQLW